MKASALVWLECLDESIKSDFDKLKEAFLKQYTLSKTQQLAELNALLSRQQAPGEPVEAYLLDIAQRCRRLNRSKQQQLEYAINGLLPEIKSQILYNKRTL